MIEILKGGGLEVGTGMGLGRGGEVPQYTCGYPYGMIFFFLKKDDPTLLNNKVKIA